MKIVKIYTTLNGERFNEPICSVREENTRENRVAFLLKGKKFLNARDSKFVDYGQQRRKTFFYMRIAKICVTPEPDSQNYQTVLLDFATS